MRSDSDIKRDVEDELRWDPDLDSTDIAVTVKSGVVTLAGFTRSYSDKLEAEAAAKRVAGVLGVANDIEVRLPALDQRPDPEIARDAIAAIKNRVPIVAEQIKVLVRNVRRRSVSPGLLRASDESKTGSPSAFRSQ
jgi:hypothetical protein